MGQYYKAINISKKEFLSSYDYENGAKLTEHSWVGNNYVGAVVNLLGDEWSEDQIVWGGDYADKEAGTESNLYVYLDTPLYTKIKPKEEKEKYNILLNHTRKEFVFISDGEKTSFDNYDDWQLHPLPLLTCEGNGRGGGDFYGSGNQILVGYWARDSISAVKDDSEIPDGYNLLVFDLKEG